MAATCELTANGTACGVMAIGRCVDCSRAFCDSHRAAGYQVRYVDLCGTCLAKRDELAMEKGKAAARREKQAQVQKQVQARDRARDLAAETPNRRRTRKGPHWFTRRLLANVV